MKLFKNMSQNAVNGVFNLALRMALFSALGFSFMTPVILRVANATSGYQLYGIQLSSILLFYYFFLRGSVKRIIKNIILMIILAFAIYYFFGDTIIVFLKGLGWV